MNEQIANALLAAVEDAIEDLGLNSKLEVVQLLYGQLEIVIDILIDEGAE